jgi:anti-sigma regulatory factor (Ser/Thr protein kinase)
MNNFSLDLTFDVHEMERDNFKSDITQILRALLVRINSANGLAMLMIEIIKNIYDHADGKGYIRLVRRENYLDFEIRDFSGKSYNLDKLSVAGASKKAGNGINFGVGLRMIPQMAEDLNIQLQITTCDGFQYKGTYTFPGSS